MPLQWHFATLIKIMALTTKIKTQKKYRYLLQSVLATLFLFLFSTGKLEISFGFLALVVFSLALFGTILIHYPNVDLRNVFFVLLMPVSLMTGALLFINFFPNLGQIFKVTAILVFGLLYYVVSLVDNVFLVVEDREEVIPLYTVATAWSQVVQVVVAIPLFSGIFKLNFNGVTQSGLVAIVAFLYVIYQIWSSRYDKDAKNTKVGESLLLSILGMFLVLASSIAIIFIPSEAFLRALLISAVLMFVLSYIASYLRNDINRKMIVQFVIIFLVFLSLILIFTP